MKKWRCRVCGYVHEGPVPPERAAAGWASSLVSG
ncbi:MAG: rubredoxin-like domain-containing protein [Bacillota bacterium]